MEKTLDANLLPPLASYFEKEVYDREVDKCFNQAPYRYVGHALMAPNPGDFRVLETMNGAYVLYNNKGKHQLVHNICPHRQASIIPGEGRSGNTKVMVCKLHKWSFDPCDGRLTGAPYFEEKPNACLKTVELHNWNGLLFTGRSPGLDLEKYNLQDHIKFDGFKLGKVTVDHYDFNWKTFMEVYLENLHVPCIHPGLKKFVDPLSLKWSFGEDYSVQELLLNGSLDNAGSAVYGKWHEAVKDEFGSELPKYGALWLLIYPNVMVEWYPGAIVNSIVIPVSPQKCINVLEYYYEADKVENNPEFIEREKAAYCETAVEDSEACWLIDQGRRSLYLQGEKMVGGTWLQGNLEGGIPMFYKYLEKKEIYH